MTPRTSLYDKDIRTSLRGTGRGNFLKRRLARIVEEDLQQLSIRERIKKLRSQIQLEVTAEKSASSSSSSVDADKSGVAAGSFTWPKAYQGALMRMQSEEPYVSIVSEVCACPRPHDAVELIIKGASRLHPARRPSAILLSLYYDSKKDPPSWLTRGSRRSSICARVSPTIWARSR